MSLIKKEHFTRHSELQIPLLKSFKADELQEKEQKHLRAEYDIESKEIVIVEKKNAVAQIVRTIFQALFTALRIISSILLVVLATIGLTCLIYPSLRKELISTVLAILGEVKGYLPVYISRWIP